MNKFIEVDLGGKDKHCELCAKFRKSMPCDCKVGFYFIVNPEYKKPSQRVAELLSNNDGKYKNLSIAGKLKKLAQELKEEGL